VRLRSSNGLVATLHVATASAARRKREISMTLGTILLIVLILFLVGALPTWGHSRNWGYGPSGGLGLVLVIVLILLVLGKI
jgi:hypothetical protein